MPHQLLKPSILDFAFDRVHIAASATRSVLKASPNFDRAIYHRALAAKAGDDKQHHRNVVKTISTLSGVEASLLHRFGVNDDDECPSCPTCKCSVHHLIWFCKHSPLAAARTQEATIEEKFIIERAHTMPLPCYMAYLRKWRCYLTRHGGPMMFLMTCTFIPRVLARNCLASTTSSPRLDTLSLSGYRQYSI